MISSPASAFLGALPDLCHKVPHLLCGILLHLAGGVGVGSEGESRVIVTQHGGDRFDIDAVLQGHGCESMAQIVESQMGQTCVFQHLFVEAEHRVSAEYCGRRTAEGEQTCREMGAFQQWEKKQREDPVFKAYRKEYKRRFAWIRAGRISSDSFYAWSERAREKKKECDREIITLDEYIDWLKSST